MKLSTDDPTWIDGDLVIICGISDVAEAFGVHSTANKLLATS